MAIVRSVHRHASALALGLLAGCSTLGDVFQYDVDRPDREGAVRFGRQVGDWRFYFIEDENRVGLKAAGEYESDKQVGKWRYYYPDGKPQWDVTFEREAMHGATTFYHPGGGVRSTGAFDRGLADGHWTFFDEDGNAKAAGFYAHGKRVGDWRFWNPSGELIAEGEHAVASREAAARTGGSGLDLPERRAIPIRPQPGLTLAELDVRDYLVELYTRGRSAVDLPTNMEFADQTGDYGGAQPGKLKFRDRSRSEALVGQSLPVRFLTDVGGRELDLLAPAARSRRSIVVLLRGQTDEVCIYCLAQTESLELCHAEFDERETDITIVYPGQLEHLDSFLEIYASEFGGTGPEDAKFAWAFDADFELVDRLDVRHEFAWPTTLVLDGDGVIRYAYVGLRIDDRPSAHELLEFLDGM